MPTAQENKQIVADAYAAMAAGDVRGFLGALDPEVEVHEPPQLPHGGTYRGIGELKQMFGKAAGVLRPGAMEVLTITADEDRVVAVLRLGLSSGGDALASEHWRLRDGKAVELRVFWENPAAAAA